MTTTTPIQVRVTRRFDATPDRVFDACLNPESIGAWMFGPAVREEEVVRITNDPRVGGSFSFVVRRQGEEINHVGEYLEIQRPWRLAFTWGIDEAAGSRVAIDIVAQDDGCELTLTPAITSDSNRRTRPIGNSSRRGMCLRVPWRSYGENNDFVIARRQTEHRQAEQRLTEQQGK
jgi:uncharacterized protein YndB with AHSA1/START domain